MSCLLNLLDGVLEAPGRIVVMTTNYIEKLDISEELSRLQQHIILFKQTIEGDEYAGKKLGFIAQELGREINTIGSKANDSEIQHLVVDMKDLLERIKEQLNNVV